MLLLSAFMVWLWQRWVSFFGHLFPSSSFLLPSFSQADSLLAGSSWQRLQTHTQYLDVVQGRNAVVFVFFFPDTNPQCQPLWECVRVCSDGLGCCPPCCHRLSSYHLNSWMALYPSTSLPLWQNWLGRVFHRGLSMAFLSLLTNLWSGPGLKYFVLSCTVLLSVEYLFYCSVLISCSRIQVNMF